MPDAYIFVPKSKTNKKRNFEEFIHFVEKNFPPINNNFYQSNYWCRVCNFTKLGVSSRTRSPDTLLHPSLIRFAKAYITYSQTLNLTRHANEIYAFRALDLSIEKNANGIDFTSLTPADFERALQISRQFVAPDVAYLIGRMLQNLHAFLKDKGIIDNYIWTNPQSKDPYCSTASDEANRRRQEKMPDEQTLLALASVFSQSTEMLSARDIFTTSSVALLLSAPVRGSELFYLQHDCLYKEKMTVRRALECGFSLGELQAMLAFRNKVYDYSDVICLSDSCETDFSHTSTDNEVLQDDDVIELTGIRWFSGKGYGYANKWIPTVMIPIVERAIERLKIISAPAREFAKKLEESTDFPRHPLCPDVNEDALLTQYEVVAAFGFDISELNLRQAGTSSRQILKRKGVISQDYAVNLRDLNKIIRNDLNKEFPYVPYGNPLNNVQLRWSEALYAGFSNIFASKKTQICTELWIATINTLAKDFGSSHNNADYKKPQNPSKTIFERWGYGNLSLRSHQLRHMLNTMALVNGMSEMAIAKWAQRADSQHNHYYDHTTPDEYGEDFAQSQDIENFLPEVVVDVLISTPKTIQELKTKASLTAHTTEFGMCISSYLSEPCGRYRDCINCNEHVLLKGDSIKCERLRHKLKMEEGLLLKDQKAVDNGVPGAAQWLARRILTVERCREVLRLLTSPDIRDGSLVKLDIQDYSPLDRAMIANNKKILPRVINYMRENKCLEKDISGTEIIDLEAMISGRKDKGLSDKKDSGDDNG